MVNITKVTAGRQPIECSAEVVMVITSGGWAYRVLKPPAQAEGAEPARDPDQGPRALGSGLNTE